ncbi:hypothetical protein ACWIUH_11695 [Ursidibacter arcticus]
MNKYYLATTAVLLVKNKPLVNHISLFRTEQKARDFAKALAEKIEESPVFVMQATVKELYLTVLNHKTQGEIIVGVGSKATAEELKAEHQTLFTQFSFSVRPFQETDFIEKTGAFYA